jgi:hypothetical protein
VCDQETSKTRRLKPATGLWIIQPQWVVTPSKQTTTNINKKILFLNDPLNPAFFCDDKWLFAIFLSNKIRIFKIVVTAT